MSGATQRFDAIVIGSGIGGLSCAAVLSLLGKRVLVMERNGPGSPPIRQTVFRDGEELDATIERTVGGCLQTITFDRWSWSLGLQYIALFPLERALLPLITDPPVSFSPLDPVFQRLKLPDLGDDYVVDLWSDRRQALESLLERFPDQAAGLERYWGLLDEADRKVALLAVPKLAPPLLARLLFPLVTHPLRWMMDRSFEEAMTELFGDGASRDALELILASNWHMTALPLDTSFLIWVLDHHQLLYGTTVPDGGSRPLVDGLVGAIRRRGGELRTGEGGRAREVRLVRGLLGWRATGVVAADGTAIDAPIVVSAVGMPETVGTLVPAEAVARRVRRSVEHHESRPSDLVLRLGLDLDRAGLEALGVRRTTYRTMRRGAWEMADDPTAPGWAPDDVTIFFPTYYFAWPGEEAAQTAEVGCFTSFQRYFSRFTGLDDPAFREAERRIVHALRASFAREFPALDPHVRCMLLTSPLALSQQIHHRDGSMYGLDDYGVIDPDVQPRSGIAGFYLSGEDVFTAGVTMANGVFTASAIVIDELLGAAPRWAAQMLGRAPAAVGAALGPRRRPRAWPPDRVRERAAQGRRG